MTAYKGLQIGAMVCIMCVGILWIMCRFAKPGHEDADGFHDGHEHSDYDLES